MKKLLLVAFLLLLTATFAGRCRRSEDPVRSEQSPQPSAKQAPAVAPASGEAIVGAMMPAYSAEMLDGTKFDVAGERGKVVLLNLWATWCGPCRAEIPELEELHKKYAPQGFKVVGVSLDEAGRDAVKQFVDEQKMTYPVALDPDGRLANVFQTVVVPTSVLIDRGGKIVWKQIGAIEPKDEALRKAIDTAVAEKV